MEKLSLGQATARGVFWNFLELTARQGIGILVTLLLARFLSPADFGLVAMLSVFFAIANALMDAGFRQALIRKKDATPADYSTMFYTNLALGLTSYFLLFLSAPAISAFYKEPRLTILTRVVGLVVIINSFQFVQIVELTRRLDFKTQFKIAVPAGLFSGIIAVIMARSGLGVWSLVTQMMVTPLLVTSLLWYLNNWRPILAFSRKTFLELWGFGSKLLVTSIMNVLFDNIYVIVVAKLFSTTLVGCFFFAQKIQAVILHQLTVSIQNATFPTLASIQDDDERLKSAYRKIMRSVAYLIFPAMTLLGILAKPLFLTLLHPRWLPAVPYLQLLCVAGFMYPFHAINQNLLQVKGRSDLFLYLEIFKKVTVVIVLLASFPFGIIIMLIGRILVSFINYIPTVYLSNRLIHYPIQEQVLDVLPTLLVSIVTAIVLVVPDWIFNLPQDNIWLLLLRFIYSPLIFIIVAAIAKIKIQYELYAIIKERLRSFSLNL
jgi:O-antigen/teichoic acid export membrane protein